MHAETKNITGIQLGVTNKPAPLEAVFNPTIGPNKANAIKLLEFLVTVEAQKHIVNNTFEYPIIEGVEPNKLISQFGLSFKQDLKTKVSAYYKNQAAALKLMTEAGWN